MDGARQADPVLEGIAAGLFTLFAAELLINSVTLPDYAFGFFWW